MLIKRIYDILFNTFGPQNWWPGDTPLEIAIGAILTQNTAWKNVERAINNLKRENLIDVKKLLSIDIENLKELIRPAGFYNQKAERLKEFVLWLREKGGCLTRINEPTEALRIELLSLKGIGPETADSILLYAMHRPVFVVDAYTKRILSRHNIIDDKASYNQIQSLFVSNLPEDVQLYKEYHALLVKLGKTYCKKNNPLCGSCPLSGIFFTD